MIRKYRKKIAVVTATRAEYGVLKRLLKILSEDKDSFI